MRDSVARAELREFSRDARGGYVTGLEVTTVAAEAGTFKEQSAPRAYAGRRTMQPTHDVHLIFNSRDTSLIKPIDAALRARGLNPWYWERDIVGGDVTEVEESSIRSTPVSAVLLGSEGWGPFHERYTRLALELGRPIVPVLLPHCPLEALEGSDGLFRRLTSAWVRLRSVEDATELNALAQRIVDAAYESPAPPGQQPNGQTPAAAEERFRPAPGPIAAGRRLIVYVPARSQTPEDWQSLRKRLEVEPALKGAVWHPHRYQADAWSRDGMEKFALDLEAEIDGLLLALDAATPACPIEHITLMGHSFGGMLVRIAYLIAAGQYPETKPRGSAWWKKVDRIVLFAAPNRGIETRRLSWREHWREKTAFLVPRREGGVGRLMRDQLIGSAAVTNLRIRWIRFIAGLAPSRRPAVVQFLGRGDRLVKRDDSLDFEQFPETWQVDVPGATHSDVQQVPEGDDIRYFTLRAGILEAPPEPQSTAELPRGKRNPVVLVVHGIRASNETWAAQLKDLIQGQAPSAAAFQPTYRYFPMLDFALPWLRARKVRWLQDQYSTLLARYPRARFNFVGHSNGTYLLGHSLRQVPAMTFDRVTLAGSVLPREYDWNNRFMLGQVREVANHRAASDLPVAIFCNLLRAFGTKDVGTAGFDGFDESREEIKETFYYAGGHSSALTGDNLPKLAEFTLSGKADFPLASKKLEPRKFASRLSGSTLVALLAAGALVAVLGVAIAGLSQVLVATVAWASVTATAAAAAAVLGIVYLVSRYF